MTLVDVSFQKSIMEGLHLQMDFNKHEGVYCFRNTYFFKINLAANIYDRIFSFS